MIDGMKYTFAKGADGSDGATFSDKNSLIAAAAKNGITINANGTVKKGGTALTLQIGDTGDDFNQLKVNIADTHAKALGIADIDISTQAGAKAAVDKIKAAINYVSDVRGTLGATQNRLDHTINNLSVMTENIQGRRVHHPRHRRGRRDDGLHQEQHPDPVRPGHAGSG